MSQQIPILPRPQIIPLHERKLHVIIEKQQAYAARKRRMEAAD